MGLETVELVMDVEESFGISIPDEKAQDIVTVGDLFEFVKSRAKLAPAGTCLTAATFYDVKRALRDRGISQRFGPSTHLADILPSADRRSFWNSLGSGMQLKLPELERSKSVSYINAGMTLVLSLIVAWLIAEPTAESSFIVFFISAIIFAVLTSYATRPLATHFGSDFETFRGFSERVLAMNAAKQESKHGPMGANDIWIILRDLIVEQLGCDRDEVVPDAQFVRDLGCR